MINLKESVNNVNEYLRVADIDKKLSVSETRKLENIFYKRTFELQCNLEALELLKAMPKSNARTTLMQEIEHYLSHCDSYNETISKQKTEIGSLQSDLNKSKLKQHELQLIVDGIGDREETGLFKLFKS